LARLKRHLLAARFSRTNCRNGINAVMAFSGAAGNPDNGRRGCIVEKIAFASNTREELAARFQPKRLFGPPASSSKRAHLCNMVEFALFRL